MLWIHLECHLQNKKWVCLFGIYFPSKQTKISKGLVLHNSRPFLYFHLFKNAYILNASVFNIADDCTRTKNLRCRKWQPSREYLPYVLVEASLYGWIPLLLVCLCRIRSKFTFLVEFKPVKQEVSHTVILPLRHMGTVLWLSVATTAHQNKVSNDRR